MKMGFSLKIIIATLYSSSFVWGTGMETRGWFVTSCIKAPLLLKHKVIKWGKRNDVIMLPQVRL
jgi:hypothetical protein